MKVQFFTTPSGDEMAILSRADYDALTGDLEHDAEDAADIAMFDARLSELSADPSAILPAEITAFLLKGNNRLKAVRKWRGLSQSQLAHQSGIGQGYLSEIESGNKPGSDETMASLAKALDVPIIWIK